MNILMRVTQEVKISKEHILDDVIPRKAGSRRGDSRSGSVILIQGIVYSLRVGSESCGYMLTKFVSCITIT